MFLFMVMAPFGVLEVLGMVGTIAQWSGGATWNAELFRVRCVPFAGSRRGPPSSNACRYSLAKSSTMRSRHWGSTRAPNTPVLL